MWTDSAFGGHTDLISILPPFRFLQCLLASTVVCFFFGKSPDLDPWCHVHIFAATPALSFRSIIQNRDKEKESRMGSTLLIEMSRPAPIMDRSTCDGKPVVGKCVLALMPCSGASRDAPFLQVCRTQFGARFPSCSQTLTYHLLCSRVWLPFLSCLVLSCT